MKRLGREEAEGSLWRLCVRVGVGVEMGSLGASVRQAFLHSPPKDPPFVFPMLWTHEDLCIICTMNSFRVRRAVGPEWSFHTISLSPAFTSA